MNLILLTIVALLATTLNAQPSICDFYSVALNISNLDLVSGVVAQTVQMSLESNLVVFFNGQVPEGSTNFTDPANEGAFINLFNGLVSFFGVALGCTDETIAPYDGPTLADAHAGMPITAEDFDLFNGFIISILDGAGVIADDLTTVHRILDSTRLDICNECPPPSICDKYSHALGLTNNQLVTYVVNETVIAALTSDLVVFFNGEVPEGSTNFGDPDNVEAFINLFNGLVEFFGMALGCTDGTIGEYTGPSLADAHAGMPINATQFEQFNQFIIDILDAAGVTADDLMIVHRILDSTRIDICNDCPPPSICDKYSHALGLTNDQLVTFVVNETVIAALTSDLVVFFNGEVPEGSTNFADPDNLESFINLFNGLVKFFGMALGCTDGTIGEYTGPTLLQAHEGMPINATQFEQFNQFIIDILDAAGVTADDLDAVAGVLESTRGDVCTLCTAETSDVTGGTDATTGTDSNSTEATDGTDGTDATSENGAIALAISFSLLVLA